MQRPDRWLYGWALGYVAVGAASLLVPLFAIELGADAFLVGIIAATAAFAGVPGALLWGRLAARTRRRRPFVLVALASTAVVLGLLPLARSPAHVLLLNAGLWFVVAAAAPVLNLIVVEGHPEDEWNVQIGRLNAYQGYGWVAGLLLGTGWTFLLPRISPAHSATSGQRLLFLLLSVSTVVAFVLTRLWYPEPSTVSTDRFRRVYQRLSRENWGAGRYLRTLPYGTSRIYWGLTTLRPARLRALRDRYGASLTRYLLATTLFSVGFAVFWGPMPAYLTGAGMRTDTVFVLFLLANVGSAAAYERVGALASEHDPRVLQTAALATRVVLFPLVAVLGTLADVAALGAGFAIIGITWAVIAVTAVGLVTRLAAANVRGEALGAYTALVALGTGIGSAVGGAVASSVGYLPAFAVASTFVVLGGILVVRA